MSSTTDETSGIGHTACVQRERIPCPKCDRPISVPKDFVRTGGVVRCGLCGTAYRRMARPNYMWDYREAGRYVSTERYFYYDKTKPEKYVTLHIRSYDEYLEALTEHKTLYIQVQKKRSGDQFELRGVMCELPRR